MGILLGIIFWMSILFSLVALFYTIIVRNWKSFLCLGVVSLPFSLYSFSGEPPIQFVGLFSLACFAISFLILWRKKLKTEF
ncbi:MAG TPA: hypothetical protein VLQ66_02810 [Paenisporosarcina sp.]|nr:hypothetical protein [Paenisporosarcina sp.]